MAAWQQSRQLEVVFYCDGLLKLQIVKWAIPFRYLRFLQ